jgi:hypothetical protein
VLKLLDKEVLSKKKAIVAILGVNGVQIDMENQLMRHILGLKRKLKVGIEQLLQNVSLCEE